MERDRGVRRPDEGVRRVRRPLSARRPVLPDATGPRSRARPPSSSRRPIPYLGQEISGHIEIRQLVGIGAMGRVYRAFQRGIDRDVAVKILHRELSRERAARVALHREAKVASRLQHPNVVQVLLAGQLPDRALYIVMEYLDGLSLLSALAAAGGALPLAARAPHRAADLRRGGRGARAGHRASRPQARERDARAARRRTPTSSRCSTSASRGSTGASSRSRRPPGLIFGTARYISPEGAQGNAVGPASDVYSIATMLYQMLAGRTPFEGDQAVGLLVQQIHDRRRSCDRSRARTTCPSRSPTVIMANLAKDPAKREPDARAFGQAIFDAAKLAGLSPDEFSRPMMQRQPTR